MLFHQKTVKNATKLLDSRENSNFFLRIPKEIAKTLIFSEENRQKRELGVHYLLKIIEN